MSQEFGITRQMESVDLKKNDLATVTALMSSTTADSRDDFSKIQRGTEVHHWDDPLQESDRVIHATSKVLLTRSLELRPCEDSSRCILCHPNLEIEDYGATVLLTTGFELPSESLASEELFDQEIASEILKECCEGRALLTQAEMVKEANGWKISHPNEPKKEFFLQ